jgi:hypothetical protein
VGTQADRWFADLLLGLAALSPRIARVLDEIAARAPEPPTPPDEGPDAPPDDVLGEDGSLGR